MTHRAIPEQVLFEHEVLMNITEAIRATIGWKFQGEDHSRKLSSLAFAVGSLERHLQHLLKLEEEEGYMDVIQSAHPHLVPEVVQFRNEHDEFRAGVSSFGPRLAAIGPTDHTAFHSVCDDLLQFLHRVEAHGERETDLIRDALL